MKIKLLYISILAVGIFISSCKKTETPTPIGKTFTVVDTSFTKWVYFSFTKGDTLQVSRPDTSTAWDLSFQRANIKTNSGLSGVGNGGGAIRAK